MTVSELIRKLQVLPDNYKVMIAVADILTDVDCVTVCESDDLVLLW